MKYDVSFSIELRRNPYKGRFIAFEGIDGSGKSTQASLLKSSLEQKGRVVTLRNPFEGEIGVFIRSILSGKKKVSPIAIQYLISANRSNQQEEIIKELKKGHDVIIDRYFWSAVTYGILDHPLMDKSVAAEWLLIGQSILSQYHQFISPDIIFFIDISTKTAMKRLDQTDKVKEIYEEEGKVRKSEEIFKWLITQYSQEFVVVNGEQSTQEITKELVNHIAALKQKV